jgi:hypothetical protein
LELQEEYEMDDTPVADLTSGGFDVPSDIQLIVFLAALLKLELIPEAIL